jgi:hypothetical protein
MMSVKLVIDTKRSDGRDQVLIDGEADVLGVPWTAAPSDV